MTSLSPAPCVPASLDMSASRTPYSPAGMGSFYANLPFPSDASARSAAYTHTSLHARAFTQQQQAYAEVQKPQSFVTPLHSLQHPPSLHPTSAPSTPAQTSIRPSSGAWGPQDDSTLMAARAQGMNWAPIQQAYFPSKTANACRKRHERLVERSADDWGVIKIENLAKHYMAMRREIWAPLAAVTGEKWNVVEQKYYSNDSGYADDDMETQLGDIDSESTLKHEYAQYFPNKYHQLQHAMSSVPTATIASNSATTSYFSAAATSSTSQAGTESSSLRPQKAESVHLNAPTNISNTSHLSIAATADSYLKEIPEDDSRLQRKADNPIDPFLPPRIRAALVKHVSRNDSSIHVNESHNVQLQLRTSSPPENIRSLTQLAARDEDPGATANEAGISLIKQSDTRAKSSPSSSNSKPIQLRDKPPTESRHSDESSDDENSLISWEDRIHSEDSTVLSPEAKNKVDMILSLMAALRYRLLSELMLSFHLRCRQSLTETKPQFDADSPSEDRTTSGPSPRNPTEGDVSTPNASFTSRGNLNGVPNPSNARHSNHKRRPDQDDDDDDETNKKRKRRDPPGSSLLSEKVQRLVCPYHHRDPGSFGLNGVRVCANTWPDIAKLKEHLYRKHYVKFQCQRCKEDLRSRPELDTHAEAKISCLPRTRQLKDGFMFETYEWLRNKKSAFPGQTQREKWQAIYDHLFLSDESLSTFDLNNWACNGSSILADVTSTAANNSLDLLQNYLPSAEAIVARRLKPVEERLLEQVSGTNQKFQGASFGSTQNLPPSSTQERDDEQAKVSHSPADSGFGAYITPMPSIETPRAADLVDFGTSLPEHDDFDSLLNSCFSPYMTSPLPPTQYSDQNNLAYNFCSTSMDHCVCQARLQYHSNVPGNPESNAQSSSNSVSMIQQLMQRIEALEKKQESG